MVASKPNERPHSCGDHLYCMPRKRHQFKPLGPLVLEPRGRLSTCGPFLITPSRRKTHVTVNFVHAQRGSRPQRVRVVTLPRTPRLSCHSLCSKYITDLADFRVKVRIHPSHPNERDPGRAQARVFAQRWLPGNKFGLPPGGPQERFLN